MISEFVEFCDYHELEPKAALAILNAQNWEPKDEEPITAEQLAAINAKLSLIAGEATQEQVEAVVRSVMLPRA